MASYEEYQQKKERDRLIKSGVSRKEASQRAKEKFPLSKDKAKKKNKQPGGGLDDPGRGGRRGGGRGGGDDGSGRQTGRFGKGW